MMRTFIKDFLLQPIPELRTEQDAVLDAPRSDSDPGCVGIVPQTCNTAESGLFRDCLEKKTLVLAHWLHRGQKQVSLPDAVWKRLFPLCRLPLEQRATALHEATQFEQPAGLIRDLPDRQHWCFLSKGSVQVQTSGGYVLQIRANSEQARYPLPSIDMVTSLYATEPCELLSVRRIASDDSPNTTAAMRLSRAERAALDELRGYFDHERCELPSLPDLALQIGWAIDDPSNANQDVARLIQLDPSLSARLMGVVNSPAFGGTKRITSIHQATTRLGRGKVRSLVYSCLLKGIFKINAASLKHRMEALWRHAADVGALSYVLARVTPGIDPEQALLAGLIHDIGAVAVIGGINRYPLLAERAELLEAIIAEMRIAIGLQTLQQWNLPAEFADVVRDASAWTRYGSAIPELADVVILARLHALIGSPEQAQLPRLDSVPAFTKLAMGKLTPRASLAILDNAEKDVREIRALIGGV